MKEGTRETIHASRPLKVVVAYCAPRFAALLCAQAGLRPKRHKRAACRASSVRASKTSARCKRQQASSGQQQCRQREYYARQPLQARYRGIRRCLQNQRAYRQLFYAAQRAADGALCAVLRARVVVVAEGGIAMSRLNRTAWLATAA